MRAEYCFGSSPVAAEVLRFRPKSGSCMPRHTASESDTEPTAAVSTRKTSRRTYRSAIIARSPAACGFSGPITRPDVSPLTRFCTILPWDMSQRTCWKGRLSKSATTFGSERTRSFCRRVSDRQRCRDRGGQRRHEGCRPVRNRRRQSCPRDPHAFRRAADRRAGKQPLVGAGPARAGRPDRRARRDASKSRKSGIETIGGATSFPLARQAWPKAGANDRSPNTDRHPSHPARTESTIIWMFPLSSSITRPRSYSCRRSIRSSTKPKTSSTRSSSSTTTRRTTPNALSTSVTATG